MPENTTANTTELRLDPAATPRHADGISRGHARNHADRAADDRQPTALEQKLPRKISRCPSPNARRRPISRVRLT